MIRSAATINAEIRELWAGGSLATEDVDRYYRLVVEYAEALQAEREQAA
ncbi:hypothetical protein ABT264_29060 [Streptomyces virginiae]